MNIITFVKKNLFSCIKENKVFTYDGETIKAIAFINGFKHEKLDELKKVIKKFGFYYDFDYSCYIKSDKDSCLTPQEREDKNKFISEFIKWKVAELVPS